MEHPETIVIDLKKDANVDLIINYLLKNTELQISYNFNMVAIVNRRPMTMGILDMLDAYIAHQKEVILKRTKFDLEHAKSRMHIVEGLIKALSILDDVIKTIRASKNKGEAEANLVKEYAFSELQAKAIVELQLYKLTNTDVTELIEEKNNLEILIKGLEEILNNPEVLKNKMKEELRSIKKEYATPRKTQIEDEVTEIKIDTTSMIPKEDCMVVVTRQGYVKRVSMRSYATNTDDTLVKEGDYVIGLYEMNTLDTVLLFTDLGNYLYVPVHELPDLKWKELGKHISNIIKIDSEENIVASYPVYDFNQEIYFTSFSKDGLVKRTKLEEFKVSRYSKPMCFMKLKSGDKLVSIDAGSGKEIFVTTKNGYGLRYLVEEVSVTGIKSSGVKAISLKNDEVVSGHVFESMDYITVLTSNGTGKRVKLSEFEIISRARKGVLLVRDVKTNPYHILKTFITNNKNMGIMIKNDIEYKKITELPIVDRYSTGTVLSKKGIDDVFLVSEVMKKESDKPMEKREEPQEEIIDISLDEVDEKILTIDDFLEELDIE